MRAWILVLSIVLAPAAARAADSCPMADSWYRRWADCRQYLRPLDPGSRERVRLIVEAHTLHSGSNVTWEEEAEALFQLLPEDLRQRPSLEYIQCREFEAGRICKSQWESRSRCMVMRKGRRAMEFPAGATVDIDLRTTRGLSFRGATASLPPAAEASASGAIRLEEGRLRWDSKYARGAARIRSPRTAGPWTLAFDDLATRGTPPEWVQHDLGFSSGGPSPHELALPVDADLRIAWTCSE